MQGEYIDIDQEAEEGEKAKGANVPTGPTREEYDRHQLNHWPYREWCPFCVKGRGMSNKHQSKKGEVSTVPVVIMDYMFMSEASGKEDTYVGMPIIVMADRNSDYTCAGMVPEKGELGHAIKGMRKNLDWLGYNIRILKSDQEPAIKSLKAATIRERPEEVKEDRDILTADAPVGESQSNGYIERRIKTVQGVIRTIRGALEARSGRRLDSTSDITPWLVTHTAHTLGRYSKGTDGRTPHARLRGRNFNKTVCEFGERVLYLIPQTSSTATWSMTICR